MKQLAAVGVLVAGFGIAANAQIQIGTGLDGSGALLPQNALEQNYSISGNAAYAAAIYAAPGSWVANGPTGQWIDPSTSGGSPTDPNGFTYFTRTITGTGSINLQFATDNAGALVINGVVVAQTQGWATQTDTADYETWVSYSGTLNPGVNTIEFEVNNLGGPAGLIVEGTFTATPVPEPTTVISGALLLLPFGASALQVLRKRKTVS
jgi:hypothetical protein